MAFLTVNGLTLPVTPGSVGGVLEEIAESSRTMQGKPRKERSALLDSLDTSLFKVTNAEASFLEVVLEGLFHRVPFDDDDNSTDGYLNSGTSSIVNSANAKTGHGYAELDTYAYAWPFELRASPNAWWSLMYWRSTLASPTTWDHFIVNSDGTQYKNGVLEVSATSLSELTVTDAGEVQLAASTTVQADELVVFRAQMTATQAAEVFAWLDAGNAWTDPPEVRLEGSAVDDRPRTAIAEIGGEPYVDGGLDTGWANNIRRLAVDFAQSRSEVGLRIPSADLGWVLDTGIFIGPSPLPQLGNLVLDFGADSPGTGNRPVDAGSYNIGNLSTVSGSPAFNATGGPGGGAYWSGDASAGYRPPSGGAKTVTEITSAMVVRCTSVVTGGRYLLTAASTDGGGGGVVVTATDLGSFLRFEANGANVTSDKDVGTSWYVLVSSETTAGSSGKQRLYDLGSTTPIATASGGSSYSGSGFGTYVSIGLKAFSFAVTAWGIAQVRIWDKELTDGEADDVALHFKELYGL